MTTTLAFDDLPLFPAPAPAVFSDPVAARALTAPVLEALATVVGGVTADDLARPTPCPGFTVEQLLDHVLGWLQFFSEAMADPRLQSERSDPMAYRVADDGRELAGVVREAAGRYLTAVDGGALAGEVAVSQSRMPGPGVAGMFLGEYLAHGWDLAAATGQPWAPADDALEAAQAFFADMITPEYRGGPEGYFGEEIAVPDDAPALDRYLGFCGRDPRWTPPAA